MTTKRSKFAALAVGLALIVAACGDDDDNGTSDTAGETTPPSDDTTPPDDTSGEEPTDTTGGGDGEAAMRITYDIAENAVWNDGSPIVADDFVCTYNAVMNTVGSLSTVGYDQILTIAAGDSDKQVVVDFKTVYAPYRGLFGALIKHDAVADCNDISGDLQTDFPFSNRPYQLQSWSDSQLILEPNPNWFGDPPVVEKVVMVPKADQETEINALLAGEVDFIYPQYSPETADAVAGDSNVKVGLVYGGDYEGLYFQQQEGPFADPIYRQAFAQSIDMDAFMSQIYAPIVADAEQLTCGPIVPGPYCDDTIFQDTFDAEGAAALLTENGWTQNGDGMWANADGEVPEVRWMINSGNSRRENAQAYLIPLLQEAGFNVVADNCEADCVFQQRLPNLDYDLGMYISTAPPDPQYLTSSFACDQIPSEENNFAGQNSQGWCNEEATALLYQADATVDFDERAGLIKQALAFMREDWVMLPTFQFPKSGIYRLDRLGPEDVVEQDFVNYEAFINFPEWEDVDGDGQIVIGAEQWPGCLNPLTECSNSSWYQWTIGFPLLMGVYDTTAEGTYELTPMMASEPVVEVLG